MGKDFITKTLQKNHFVSEGLASRILAFLKLIFNDFFSGFTKIKFRFFFFFFLNLSSSLVFLFNICKQHNLIDHLNDFFEMAILYFQPGHSTTGFSLHWLDSLVLLIELVSFLFVKK